MPQWKKPRYRGFFLVLHPTPGRVSCFLSDRGLAGTQAPGFALVGRRASRNAGANVLGGEIKGEASAAGRRRRTFAPKGIRTRSPVVLRTERFSLRRGEEGRKGTRLN